ncbi:hypothetical protein [Deinococcus sp. S9]|uniref:hypothetical protein n=1 Tax=Deinococcus sp. S9 TaxID=2545754 RepID=UPI0010556240|nr:hypothetical protein [Deinococcus sp. S9]TDE85317.1 hypothetical protein E0686_12345 [Deinococcus sp. S9]
MTLPGDSPIPHTDLVFWLAFGALVLVGLALYLLASYLDTRDAIRRQRVREQMLARELSKLQTRHYRRWGGR